MAFVCEWLEEVNVMSDTPKKSVSADSRRGFIKTAAAGTAAAVTAQSASAGVYKSILPATILGANEMIRTGHIGVGGMGSADLVFVMKRNDMQPIALCDLYPKNLDKAHALAKRKPRKLKRLYDQLPKMMKALTKEYFVHNKVKMLDGSEPKY